MAKTAKLKTSKAPAPNSRSSRRAASPSLNIDKSLTTLPRPSSPPSSKQHTILAPTPGAGVSKHGSAKTGGKGKGRGRVLKRKQKIRIERGRDRAEIVGDKAERKRGLGRRGVGRNADWDEFNEKIGGRKGKGMGKRGMGRGKQGVEGGGEEDGGMDVDIDVDGDGGKGEGLKDGKDGVDVMKAVDEEIS